MPVSANCANQNSASFLGVMTRYLGLRLLPSFQHVHDITNFPKPLGHVSGHCLTVAKFTRR